MTTTHTPPRTRSQAAASATTEAGATYPQDAGATEAEAGAFEAIYLELQKLRQERRLEQQEQQLFRSEFEARLKERDATVARLQEQLAVHQLSPSNNVFCGGILNEAMREISAGEGACTERAACGNSVEPLHVMGTGEGSCAGRTARGGSTETALGYKLKPDTFDGTVLLREYLVQFNLIAQANGWVESSRTVALALSLRRKARAVLDGVTEFESLRYSELEARLELRFGEAHMSQTFYTQFTNRRQEPREELLGADLERLARLAYSECSAEVRDKIACAQFVAALSDGFVKRTFQLKGLTSLRAAIERAMAIKVIQANSFSRKFESRDLGKGRAGNDIKSAGNEKDGKSSANFKKNSGFRTRFGSEKKECWQCGAKGHFRSECPSLTTEEKGNLE
ncbi:uncharacterized protein LOC143907555 [Temnothorax americanus]|uniref:uncharacterized protein LOC143907555 n=1 Tax=Temnothorax americanus TaxID=1964332 RepID=UPI004067B3E6